MKKQLVSVVIVLVLFSGCRGFCVYVDSINSNELTQGKSCIILPELKGVDAQDLQFNVYKTYVSRALSLKGYKVLDNEEEADIVVFLSYSIERAENIYASTWSQWDIGGRASTRTIPTYAIYIVLTAYDYTQFGKSKKEQPLWKTEITRTWPNGDLRYLFPYFMAASYPYIGENTGHKIGACSNSNSDYLKIKGTVPLEYK